MIEFKLPDIGEGVAEGEIVTWLVKEGQTVEEHQPIVEVMTDKATVEIPAPAAGVISSILAGEGDTIPVGKVIFHLDNGGGAAAPAPAAAAAAAPAPAAAAAPAPAPAAAAAPASGGGGTVIEFKLPDIGEGVAEGEIVQWIVEEGTTVEEHQPVVEVMTDKATVEIPAPAAGVVTKQLAAAGETVPVGSVIFHLASAGGGAVAAPAATATATAAPTLAQPSAQPVAVAAVRPAGSKVLAVPSARRVAREMNIDLTAVAGSGRNGVIRRADVEAFAKSGAGTSAASPAAVKASAPAPAYTPPGSDDVRVPFRGVRRKIAEAMMRSVQTAAHFTVVEEVDVTDLVELRGKAKALGAKEGVKVTYMPFIMKAVALGLAKIRMLNGHLDEAAGEIVHTGRINLGIATDTPNGLIVPVIQDVQAKGVMQLAAELQELAERTRAGKVKPEELKDSTFTITNAGNIGGIMATPIINFPNIAILGVHRLMKRPGVFETPEGDEIGVRQYMNFSCSVDHRLADGADAARLLAYMRTLLETPGFLSL
ncbi:MAG: pyruvate dehydrogenase E2 component (dihydrolipoamide acetyltransferase) [Planctomycetota bacterium]|jgi:pyruvate dehydrogenase E2 component (dihydrolipoamide acetyltransferase)